MSLFANPYVLFAGLACSALGVLIALPRKGLNPQAVGGLIAAIGFGAALLALGLRAGENRPDVWFYIFALIGLSSALRVITHPRPVYAALYFILTILSSAGLYLLLSAEFMAFALIIIYAGAILITYLFVIMLATEAPSGDQIDALSEYDRYSREPVASTAAAFSLLAALVGMLAQGVHQTPPQRPTDTTAALAAMPKKWPIAGEAVRVREDLPLDAVAQRVTADGKVVMQFPSGWNGNASHPLARALGAGETAAFAGPSDVKAEDIELVGFALVGEHPLGLEIAGVILLMAMLGAVVLARKQIQIDESQKVAAAAGGGARP